MIAVRPTRSCDVLLMGPLATNWIYAEDGQGNRPKFSSFRSMSYLLPELCDEYNVVRTNNDNYVASTDSHVLWLVEWDDLLDRCVVGCLTGSWLAEWLSGWPVAWLACRFARLVVLLLSFSELRSPLLLLCITITIIITITITITITIAITITIIILLMIVIGDGPALFHQKPLTPSVPRDDSRDQLPAHCSPSSRSKMQKKYKTSLKADRRDCTIIRPD